MAEISDAELERLVAADQERVVLEASKKRLEDENTKIKKRAQDAETQLTDAEKKKLEADGKVNELLAQERKEKEDLLEKYKNRGKATLREKLRNEVSKFAKDAHDVDDLLAIPNMEVKSLLKLNEDELTVEGVEEFVNKAREIKPHYFGTKKLPDNFNNKKTGKEERGEENKSDEQRYQAELKTVTSRKELLAVKKKYGKEVDSYLGNV